LTLNGTSTYSGPTTVSNGVLLVNGGIWNSTNNGPVTVSGGTLGGSGILGGAVTVQTGGILAPGAGTNVAGTVMTLNSNLTLQAGSTTLMQVSHGTTPTSDQVSSAGTITYGGILMVATNAGDGTPYQVGDTFTLFNLGGGTGSYNAGSGFATIQPPPGPGLGWSGANLTLNGSIQVVAASPVLANFSGTPVAGVPPLAVTFTNQSSGAGYWVWNFGDGTTLSTGGGTNVSHAYANVGSYTVSLTAYGTGGVSGLTNVAYIVVGSAAPVAGFGGGPTNVFVTQTVTLTDASTGSITNWVWNFGDGHSVTNTSNASVSHAYAAAGSYPVSLTVAGAGGSNTSTQANYVVVKPKAAIGGVALSGGKFVFSGTNGVAGAQYRILTTTNVALALAGWTPVWTNVFAADGSFSYTNTPGVKPAGFFLLVSP
jgi:autotransporter-associated beta strand protein